jgi:hypothetical protein
MAFLALHQLVKNVLMYYACRLVRFNDNSTLPGASSPLSPLYLDFITCVFKCVCVVGLVNLMGV